MITGWLYVQLTAIWHKYLLLFIIIIIIVVVFVVGSVRWSFFSFGFFFFFFFFLIWCRYITRNDRRYQHVLALRVLLTEAVLKELTLRKFVFGICVYIPPNSTYTQNGFSFDALQLWARVHGRSVEEAVETETEKGSESESVASIQWRMV